MYQIYLQCIRGTLSGPRGIWQQAIGQHNELGATARLAADGQL